MALQLLLSKKIRECPQHANEYTRKGKNDNRTNGLLMHTLFLLHKDTCLNESYHFYFSIFSWY